MTDIKDETVRIFIVDDHPIVYEGINMLISREEDLYICGFAENAETAFEKIENENPDIILVDISLKGPVNGIEFIKKLKKQSPERRMLVLSMHDESIYAERSIRAGARGYVMKNEMTTIIVDAIRKVMDDEIYLSRKITSKILDNLLSDTSKSVKEPVDKLSNREIEVLRMIGEGFKSSDIAQKLDVSIKTIETHKLRIRNKLHISNSNELMRFALKWFDSDTGLS